MSNSLPEKEQIIQALRGVVEPTSRRDVVALGLVRNAAVCDGVARITFELPPNLADPNFQHYLRSTATAQIMKLAGMKSVAAEFVAQPPPRATNTLPGVKHVLAVGAGKGGVGKSTAALLAAYGLMRRGFKVGLLDADVYGPSIPKLTGTEDIEPPSPDEQGYIAIPEHDGIKIMSMGYIVAPDQAIIWRGPMAQKYVKEFIDRGLWGELDYLLVDLPPGTGDIPLTLAQSFPLSGAIVVCTPQDVALLDAVKALRMYQKLGVEVLGIVENMSYYVCPHCGHRDEIFSHGGAEKAAAELGVPFLGGIPLNIAIRINGDTGRPQANFEQTESHVRAALEQFVTRLTEEVEQRAKQRMPLPQLKIT